MLSVLFSSFVSSQHVCLPHSLPVSSCLPPTRVISLPPLPTKISILVVKSSPMRRVWSPKFKCFSFESRSLRSMRYGSLFNTTLYLQFKFEVENGVDSSNIPNICQYIYSESYYLLFINICVKMLTSILRFHTSN